MTARYERKTRERRAMVDNGIASSRPELRECKALGLEESRTAAITRYDDVEKSASRKSRGVETQVI